MPLAFKVGAWALLLYSAANLAFLVVGFDGGTAVLVDGVYRMQNHGRFLRYIDEAEFERFINLQLRFFSSGWMVFFGILAGYVWHLLGTQRAGFREVKWTPDSKSLFRTTLHD